MSDQILVFYGSYRSDRMGIRLADFVVERLRRRGDIVELIDAKAVNLPMLDRMYKEYPPGEAPQPLQVLAGKIRGADGFVFVTGEYNWGVQPGLKNLTDHFLEEWFWRPAAIASYSARTYSPAPGPQPPGTAHSRRWEWWWCQARLPLVPSHRASRMMVRRWAKAARPSKGRFRALPTI